MGLLSVYIGFGLAFVLIIVLLLLTLLKSKVNFLWKVGLILISIWYGLILFFAPQKLMGWPSYNYPPNDSIVLGYFAKEPIFKEKGYIYLLTLTRDEHKKSLIEQLDPRKSFMLDEKISPRFYIIDYDEDIFKKLFKDKKEGRQSIIKRKKDARRPFSFWGLRDGFGIDIEREEILKKE